jgi:GH35 family endo-1,4-beta-xylanase
MTHDDDERTATLAEDLQPAVHESRADAFALSLGQHCHRREPHTDHATSGTVDDHRRKQNVTGDAVIVGDERERIAGTGTSQPIDEIPLGGLAECALVHAAHAPRVFRRLESNHGRTDYNLRARVTGHSPAMPAWLNRLLVTALFALMGCGGSGDSAPSTPTTPTPPAPADPLRDAANVSGKLVGTAVQSGLLRMPQYTAVVMRHFNYLTAEYELKMGVIGQSPGSNNFVPGDAIVGFAAANGMRVKGHALVWHGSVPAWVDALSPADLRPMFENYIRDVAAHYRGQVLAWDVVNEAVADDGSGLRDTVFRRKLGDGYIAEAFRLARQADPGARLFYNDYGGEGLNAKSNRIYDLMRSLLAQGVPIDGIGLQMHITASNPPSAASVAANVRRLADLGLLVNISEMDVRIRGAPGTPAMRLELQKSVYKSMVAVCVDEPRCDAVTFWGFTDLYSWIDNQFGPDDPLLFDEQYAAKPAFYGVLDALLRR